MQSSIPIISTKLGHYDTREDIVQRPRLLDALAEVPRRRLTLLCAGPGYGKTTLLSNVASFGLPLVWYSLGPSDQDLTVFVSYLVEGIRRHRPGFGDRILQLVSMKDGGSAKVERIAGEFVNSLSEIGTDIIIVLDDYHFVDQNDAIQETANYLLMHSPPNSHLVLATRRHPRLPSLPRLRFTGQISIITEDDLRFTREEAHTLFNEVYALRLSTEAVSTIAEQTEGWIIALQLVAQSVKTKGSENATHVLASVGGQKRSLFEFLAEEVFKRQPASVQQFLCQSSVLSTFSAESCDAIFRRTDSAEMIRFVEQNNLFVVEVDDGRWRYHHLFRDFLLQEFKRQSVSLDDCHRHVGAYFEHRGSYDEAIEYYLLGADFPSAARLITKAGQSIRRLNRFDTITGWINRIPESILCKMPELLLLQAQVFEHQGHYDRTLEWAQRAADAFAATKDVAGLSKVMSSRAYVSYWRMDRQAEIYSMCRQALENLGSENSQERADLLHCLSMSALTLGDVNQAKETAEQGLRICESVGDQEGVFANLISTITSVHKLRGDFSEAVYTLNRALDLAEHIGGKHRLAETKARMCSVLRYLDRCDEAKSFGEQALAIGREIASVHLESYALECLGNVCLGGRTADPHAAQRYFEESLRLAEREGNKLLRVRALIGEVSALRLLGDNRGSISVGNRLLGLAEIHNHLGLALTAQMSVAAALIDEDPARAEALLRQVEEEFARAEDKWSLTAVNFWLSVVLSQSQQQCAFEHLEISLKIARANGYDNFFLEEHRRAVPLLVLAIRHGIYPDYCTHLLKYIGTMAVEGLRPLLSHEAPEVRQIAMEHLQALVGEVTGTSTGVAPAKPDEMPTSLGSSVLPLTDQCPPALRICCFGSFRVYLGGHLVQDSEWQRRKVKSLLSYLASVQDHKVTKDEVIELFWGDFTPDAARANLGRTLYLLRRILEPRQKGCCSSYVVSEHGLLTLRRDSIEMIDVDEFVRHVTAGQKAERLGNAHEAEREYVEATLLYAGDFLTDNPYEDWTTSKREYFRRLYLSALEKLAELRMSSRDYSSAIAYLEKILAQDCSREDVHASLMRCLARTGKRQEAMRQYSACRIALRKELDMEPMRETKALYAKLVGGESI